MLSVCLCFVAVGIGACGGQNADRVVPVSQAAFAQAAGGMDSLIKQAQAEGRLNTTTLLPHWANYGGLMDGFSKKYGIKVVNDNPDGSSQQEIDDRPPSPPRPSPSAPPASPPPPSPKPG